MRTIWKGAISFGLVNIPVKLYPATESKSIKFTYLHDRCKTPIKYKKVCPVCDREVGMEEIVKGYEYRKGEYIVLRDEDLEELPLNTIKTIDIIDFVNLEEIDPIYYQKSYFLAPGEYGVKAYRLLYEALKETGKVAVAKVVLRSKEHLTSIRLYRNLLLMETMFYPEEIRTPEDIPEMRGKVQIHDNELKMAVTLIENLSTPFKPDKYRSEYREALRELIEKKLAKEKVEIPYRPTEAKVVDLMEALRASVEAAEEKRRRANKKKRKKETG
ncbi:Ku protein [Calderihabitans maritimus]|uniref:Non-homologous end joining protein Ku n=1 Tax=Calderihabitans maritimus TaxID=1246530 RepID=A0A1Z5HUI4_9FIRM|nr:Ku protein [Calderihabitans maritimus]GAW92985.1 Ku protein [Calderihabitans maritimus]